MKYFWQNATGLKADVERHRAKERELDAKIAELETLAEPSEMDLAVLRTYRSIRSRLLESKAEVVDKIGKQK